MHYLKFTFVSLAFTYFMVTADSRRRVVAAIVAGVLVSTLVIAPPVAEAQGGLIQAIQAVLNVINGAIRSALNAINTARTAISNLYQNLIWPVQLINQARSQVVQIISQYRSVMAGIVSIKLSSATLATPQSLENVMRDHQVSNFTTLTQNFSNTYGAIPTSSDASQADRDMSDMDDALTLDTLKTVKVSDDATDLEFQAANSIETSAGQAAPGSASFLTASAVASTIRSQALTQKMLAAELRLEAAHIAHQNGFRKRGAAFATQLRGLMINLLQHN
jgi:small basic protein